RRRPADPARGSVGQSCGAVRALSVLIRWVRYAPQSLDKGRLSRSLEGHARQAGGPGSARDDGGASERDTPTPKRGAPKMLERMGLLPSPPEGHRFHAFISYSHGADARLAPALQKGLQRFAKPWYRARALRVFRDNASLSANPDLWDSIEQALDVSEFYIF